MTKLLKQRPGVVATITVLAVAGVVLTAFISLATIAASQLTQSAAVTDSEQTFFAAESGINVALNKMKTSSFPSVAPMTVNGANVTVTVEIGATPYERLVTATAIHPSGHQRQLQVSVLTSTFAVGLNYAVHTGNGGLVVNNNSIIKGDVYANGSVVPAIGNQKGNVQADNSGVYPGNLTVAGLGKRIENMKISGVAWADILQGGNGTSKTEITGLGRNNFIIGVVEADGTPCQTGVTSGNCVANAGIPPSVALPITDAEISQWRTDVETAVNDAVSGGSGQSVGSTTISANTVWPTTKVTGNLTISNNARLTMSGPLWVTGQVIFNNGGDMTIPANILINGRLTLGNGSELRLAASLAEDDAVAIVNGIIEISNGVTLAGSGHPQSSLAMLTTSNSTAYANSSCVSAICAANTSTGVIYYAKDGLVAVKQGGDLNSVLAHTIYLENNATVRFDPNLQFFTIEDPDPEPISAQPGSWREL